MKPAPEEQTRKRGFSLISRLAASTALLAAAVVLLAVIFFQLLQGTFFKDAFATHLKEWSTVLAGRIGQDETIARAAAMNHQMGVILISPLGTFAYGPEGKLVDPEGLIRDDGSHRRIDVFGQDGMAVSFFLERERFSRGHLPYLLGLIALLLVTIGVIYAIQLSQLRPLQWLRRGVDAVSQGDFSTRVPVVRADEIGQVARAFNQMTGRVEQMMNDRERLLADVSHELRSPLARIKVALEMVPESDKRDAISRDVREMESLITVLLEREQVRNKVDRPDAERFDLANLVRQVIESFADQSPGIEISELPPSLEISADAALMKVLVQNLLDNALKFSLPESHPVRVCLQQDNNEIQLIIDDDGPGVPEAETDRVFEAFVKLNPARGHRTGYGLGLNLCQRIVHAQGGSIQVIPRDQRGTRVLVTLPGS
jgi:signal transduction histidine kinase